MSIKTLLVPIGMNESDLSVLNAAAALGKRLDAHIDVLHIRRPSVNIAKAGAYANVSASMREMIESAADQASLETAGMVKARFDQWLIDSDVPESESSGFGASWNEAEGVIAETMLRWARLSDMTVLAKPIRSKDRLRRAPVGKNLEAVLLGSGRPVAVVPPNYQAKTVESIALGWNDSREASRAIAQTLPCLEAVGNVTVIVSRARESSAQALCKRLARNGLNAKTQILDRGKQSAGEALLRVTRESGADALVVGAYGQTRVTELLFGGVTQYLLSNADVPIIMVH